MILYLSWAIFAPNQKYIPRTILKNMSYAGWFFVELYYMMKRFGKRKIGKIINTLVASAIFLLALFLLGQNMIIFSFPLFLFGLFILIKTVIFV
ncbi:MAG: hypothetical protein DRN11_02215 [Thermoplasmata archaeon]|nr:MAG: hypothetical protein DRN11_02215 [Thermoplasmata archaeon]